MVTCEICGAGFKERSKKAPGRFCSIQCRGIWAAGFNRLRAYRMDDEAKEKRRKTYKEKGKRGPEHHGWKGGPEASRLRRMEKGSAAEKLRAYRARVPGKAAMWTGNRRARKLSATPAWADQGEIARVYGMADLLSRVTGKPHHVDHIVPIAGKTACGLHVASNLRAIPARLNARKSARVPSNPDHLKERGHQYFAIALLQAIRDGVLVLDKKRALALGAEMKSA